LHGEKVISTYGKRSRDDVYWVENVYDCSRENMKNKRLIIILSTALTLLLIPLLAMLFTHAVEWDLSDFVMAGILLMGTGLICEFILRKTNKKKYRILFCVIVMTGLLLIWAQLAVGIFSPGGS
jgi:Kef-type K+ transport system membrane component KefB